MDILYYLAFAALIMQLTKQQRIFIVTAWFESKSLSQVAQDFSEKFPERNVPNKTTIWKNVRKYREEGTSLNLNRGRSGRKKTARSDANIAAVRMLLDENPNVSGRRNPLQLSQVTFQRICKFDLKWHPYKIVKRHQLLPADFPRRLTFCQWLLETDERFLNSLVIGDEAAFCLNGNVNTQNVRQYAPIHNPPPFHYDRSIHREKWTVWAALVGDGSIIGPFFLEDNLNGEVYLGLLNNNIIPHLKS